MLENKGSSSRALPSLDACREGSDSSSELVEESEFDESLEDGSDVAWPSRLRCPESLDDVMTACILASCCDCKLMM